MNILYIAIGGAAGCVSRYLFGTFIQQSMNGAFPYGTFAVNIVGCFVIGLLFSMAQNQGWNSSLGLFLFTGFLGGFTTFSSFGLETINLFNEGKTGIAILYVTLSNVVGLLLTWVGFKLVG